ncbi:Histone deacetylase [Geobacter metallireducens RCH3]|uniref:Acetoin utilization protein AcuC n=1 Tax=Geobacter metallireducens (strain ATCC 53774 / DSM 7210 / GS-15) TaxID=269799 RepID=Q39UV4_GEOMG|nr:acetoin utilization protein AcuC [Geobacter metallireducens]ABB31970.1 histone deacetylase family protein [Geobacter metallireducens GS-15]EHP86319.1 Histone deacetylase [Geobacter metallireducens RCH3]
MPAKTALIYSNDFSRFSYGDDHPFKIQRIILARELMGMLGLTELPGACIHDCPRADEASLLTFHSPDYLQRLREFSDSDEPRADFRYGLGDLDNPVFKGFYDWAILGVGGTMEAARLVTEEGYDIAFTMAGGWHHAHRSKASGFSYLNDAVIAINTLVAKGLRVAYLDIDAHHGDGVQEAFYDTDQVLTVSIHESGIYFFPGTGFEDEIGRGQGRGYSVNVPLVAHTDDALFMKAFDEVAYPLIAAYNPDVLVTQLGVDTFRTDPLTRLEITTHSYTYILRKLKALKIPWVAVGGGGYNMINVARGWTLAWGIMNGVELPPKLPAQFVDMIAPMGHPNRMLLDAMHWAEEDDRNRALDAVERSIAAIRETVFPVIIGNYAAAAGE